MGLDPLKLTDFLLICVLGVIGRKYRMFAAGQNLIYYDANSPHIDALCILVFGKQNFRRHVDTSATVATDVTRLIFHAQAKIDDLQ